jgi:heme exporter protein A
LQAYKFSGLAARDVSFWRGDRLVFRAVSFDIATGECLHVLGPNGAGKTTLLRVVAGLLAPEQGSLRWNGHETRTHADDWCASFSYLAHSDGLKPELTAGENLTFETGLRRRLRTGEVEESLAHLGLADALDQPTGFLSAGQRRRVAIARVWLARVPLWILDEPFTNLDAGSAALVSTMIGDHLDAGGAALIAAHQPPAILNHQPNRLELA